MSVLRFVAALPFLLAILFALIGVLGLSLLTLAAFLLPFAFLPTLLALRLLLYPSFMFLRLYVVKRYFLNGWAGYFAARTQSFYAFLKYAKVLEAGRKEGR